MIGSTDLLQKELGLGGKKTRFKGCCDSLNAYVHEEDNSSQKGSASARGGGENGEGGGITPAAYLKKRSQKGRGKGVKGICLFGSDSVRASCRNFLSRRREKKNNGEQKHGKGGKKILNLVVSDQGSPQKGRRGPDEPQPVDLLSRKTGSYICQGEGAAKDRGDRARKWEGGGNPAKVMLKEVQKDNHEGDPGRKIGKDRARLSKIPLII